MQLVVFNQKSQISNQKNIFNPQKNISFYYLITNDDVIYSNNIFWSYVPLKEN